MGEGVTNPTDSAVEGPSVLWATCLKLVLLLGLSYVVTLRWRRQKRDAEVIPDATSKEDNTVSLRGENPTTSLTGHTGPHLRRSLSCGIVSQLESVVEDMEQSTSVPTDPQPDSFFTWDSGGNSGDYSFVHTAVELPKYPDGAITEEERQMLLLYMQSGHPELLLNAATSTVDSSSVLGPPPSADAVMCDQATVRGFLETIVEENSDDLISPSDCDEASVGWGSWDESDDDRVTVVEMERSDQNAVGSSNSGVKHQLEEQNNNSGQKSSKKGKFTHASGYNSPDDLGRQNIIHAEENELDCYDLAEKQLISLTGATSGNNCAFSSSGKGYTNATFDSSADLCEVSDLSAKAQNNILLDTNSQVSSNFNEHSDFESLWISAKNLDNSTTETFNPWCKSECNFMPSPPPPDSQSIDFNVNKHSESTDGSSLLLLESDDLCLVPSGGTNNDTEHSEEKCTFSDNFKDYFLPTDPCTLTFSKNAEDKHDMFESDIMSSDAKVRCFRIGFESEPLEIVNNEYCNVQEESSPTNSETENSDLQQETLFSPRDGDIVFGSSWLDSRVMKKPENTSSAAETRFSTMHSESPPVDNSRKSLHLSDQSASDDELQQVPNSLSRWQHHTDLQHVQEATSPITRWQHQSDLPKNYEDDKFSKQNDSDEDTDDGLPPQLKQIYSSFKMKDNKMGRIRIKEDKNNNFKKLGLWDNEAKVTLPPFITNHAQSESAQASNINEVIKEEELDDLELDMFSVNKCKSDKSDHSGNADPDIDDALKSFNHLDDYSSNSDENSESENSYTVNTVENIDLDNEDISAPSTPDMSSVKNNNYNSCANEHLKSENENTCSDNSDNCPLCTDPSFKNSKINDIFSTSLEGKFDNNVQSLLLNTFPKIKALTQENNTPAVDGIGDSTSPLTSSDSDEGIRTAKEMKKRIKRRSKDNSNAELKHDDSGYVEDDEDDDEDDSLEEKNTSDAMQVLSNVPSSTESTIKVRKSLSSAFYESKSMTDLSTKNENIPKNFEEFSSHLQQSALPDNIKDGIINNGKWSIPENLSQFSAWLLDKELKKISSRDEMEKMIVNDIISLREQTIAKFLTNSCSEEKIEFSFLGLKNDSIKNAHSLESVNIDTKTSRSVNGNSSHEKECGNSENNVNGQLAPAVSSDSDKTLSDENMEEKVENSSEELDSEYYSYNFNSNVSKINNNNNNNGVIVSNKDAQNKLGSLNKLPDIISEVIKIKTESKTNENDNSGCDLSNQELGVIKQKLEQNSKPSFTHNEMNAETSANKKQQCLSDHHPELVDTASEMHAKVICTTASVTSAEKPATNCMEVYNSNTEHSTINNACDKWKSSSDCKVPPSVEDNLSYNNFDNIYPKNTTNENSLEINKQLSVSRNSIHDELYINLIQADNNESAISESRISNSELFCAIENVPVISDNIENTAEVIKNSDEVTFTKETDASCLHNKSTDIQTPVESIYLSGEVAPSAADAPNELFPTSGNEIDLMISDTREAKGAYQGFTNEIISPQAKVVSKEVDALKHVTSVDYHAYDELASVTRPFVNDLPPSDADVLSDNVIVKTVTEELQSSPIVDLKVSVELSGHEKNSDTSCLAEELPEVISRSSCEKDIVSPEQECEQVSECLPHVKKSSDNDNSIEKSRKISNNLQLNNLYKSKSVIVLQTEEDIEEEDGECFDSTVEVNDKIFINNKNLLERDLITKSVNDLDSIVCIENRNTDLCKIKSSDDLSILPSKEKSRDIREKYNRSRSVGREIKEEEPLESWNGQSKSTPDLSRCHDQQLNSSVPLSALLSKSVSQRIQDYLGKSTRGGVLNRSLPPSERSRHYRRICVSTETVVERAARFEARSRSSGLRDSSVESVNSRSGSCPPFNMKTCDVLRSVRGYAKPTATVRPTIDISRNSYDLNNSKMVNGAPKKSEEDLFELITGYKQATKVTHKPPVPPSAQQSLKSCRLKGKIASARKEFFEKLSQPDLSPKSESKPSLDVDVDDDGTCGLRRFNEFRKSAREERARLAQSHPDLGALEAAVRSSRRRIDQLKKRRQKAPPLDAGPRPSSDAEMPGTTNTTTTTKDGTLVLPYRRCTGEIAWASCARRLEEAKARSDSQSQEPLEIVDERRFKRPAERALLRAHDYENAADDDYEDPGPAISGSDFSRARSMDFLLDNREGAEPPENRLAQRVKSEHELRIERSLQNLTLPDWYTQSKKPKEGFILRRGSEGSAGESRKRWLGFSSSRTPSATSLTTPPSSYSQRSIIIPKRVTPTSGEWRYIGSLVSSRESLTPASPASLSPRECSSAAFNYGLNSSLSRWSSSRLSTSSAPLTSVSVHRSFRQPYLGWRAAAASSGGPSRSSPGVSPLNATTPLQGSRPGSPRRGSQDHQYGYGLQQNQITSAATLRPEGGEAGDSGSRISPLALYDNSTNVFFNSNIEVPDYSTPEMRRDRYSYTQSLYSGTVIVSPGTDFKPVPSIAEDASSTTDDRFSMSKSPQPPPRIWMESSFVGTKKDGKDQVHYPQGRTIRIVPSDSVRSGDRVGGSSVRSCAPQTTMGEYVLRDFRRFGITL